MEMNEMKSCLAITKDNLDATQAELGEMKAKNMELKERLDIAEDGLTATKVKLTSSVDDLISKDHELERDVSIIRNPPFIHTCGSHAGLSITSETIPYSKLLYSSTNTEGGGLDIATGVFTSPWPGSYTVTWSLYAGDDAGDSPVLIYLRKNGQDITESEHYSHYGGPSGQVSDQGKP